MATVKKEVEINLDDVCEQFDDDDLLGCIADSSITEHLRVRGFVVFDSNKQFSDAVIGLVSTNASAFEEVLRRAPTDLLAHVLKNMEGTV